MHNKSRDIGIIGLVLIICAFISVDYTLMIVAVFGGIFVFIYGIEYICNFLDWWQNRKKK